MNNTRWIRRLLWLLAIIVGVVVFDQWIKQIMVVWIGPAEVSHRREVIGSLLAFEYIENSGAAFGLFPQSTFVLAGISLGIVVLGLIAMAKLAKTDVGIAIATALILGGAIGNLIDRIARGYVVDYIALGRFWRFNLADSAVTMGLLFAFVLVWRAERSAHPQSRQEQNV